MSAYDYAALRAHIGHDIRCVGYGPQGTEGEPWNVALECETCQEVLVDYDHPDLVQPQEVP